jgi:hypothetical protein
VVGLVWSYDPESCAGSRDDTGMASHASQVKDKKGYPAPTVSGLGLMPIALPLKIMFVENLLKLKTRWKQ